MDQEFLIAAFRRYLDNLERRPGFEIAPYDWEDAPDSADFTWMPYFWRLGDFTSTLANEINQLGHCVRRIESWRDLLQDYQDSERVELLMEFIDPLTVMALNLPSAIRGRMVFMATHLCHQANRVFQGWKEDLEDDKEITFKVLKRRGVSWKHAQPLLDALGKIDHEEHRAATRNFRNRFHHRHPPRFELGIASTMTKLDRGSGRSGYAFGIAQPLRLEDLVSPLWEQHQACLNAFKAVQELVWEQIEAIHRASQEWGSQPSD